MTTACIGEYKKNRRVFVPSFLTSYSSGDYFRPFSSFSLSVERIALDFWIFRGDIVLKAAPNPLSCFFINRQGRRDQCSLPPLPELNPVNKEFFSLDTFIIKICICEGGENA
jgi:hypothetical protein